MKCIIVAILFILPCLCNAQPAKPLLPLRFEHIAEKDGLSNNTVNEIFCDSRGFMWFGTIDGLNMYDGSSLSIYRHSMIDTLSVAGNTIGSVVEDKNNNLWIGAHCSGLSMLNPFNKKCTNYFATGNAGSLTSSCDLSAVFDKNNNLWVSNRSAVSVLNKAGKTFKHYFPFGAKENNLIYKIAITGNTIWMSHAKGIKSFDIITKKFAGTKALLTAIPADGLLRLMMKNF